MTGSRPPAVMVAIMIGVAVVIAAACSDDGGAGARTTTQSSTAAPTPTAAPSPTAAQTTAPASTPSATPSPPSAVGPLLVYINELRTTDAYLPGSTRPIVTYRVVTYDVGAGRRLASFQVDKQSGPPNDIVLAGNKIAVNAGQGVVLYGLDGSAARELHAAPPEGSIMGIDLSPDGSKLALTEQTTLKCTGRCPYADITSIVFVDVASERELLTVPQSAPGFAEFRGQAWELTWRDDEEGVVVRGATYSEQPGGRATVLLDGSVRVHDLRGFVFVAPNGRYAAHGFDLSCMNVIGHGVSLRDLDSGTDVATIQDDILVFGPGEWSPDSTEYLYSTYAARPGTPAGMCPESAGGPLQWHKLRVDGSTPSVVPDPEVLRDQWYGTGRPKLLCGDRVVLYPYCTDERGVGQPVDLYVGDTKIDSGSEIWILGFIEVPVR